MSGTRYAMFSLLLLLFMRGVMGIRFPEPITTIIGVVLGSLFPDTDIIGSPDSLFPVLKIYKLNRYLHSIFFLLVFFSVATLIRKSFGIGFFVGYGFHLILDKIKGEPMLYLWYPYRVKQDNTSGD
ncbi:MAG TPA: hypothetical protein DDZ89_18145 [Clostridiales bacterium]|nr:hypothetical protein [Clostridiales bacterium]